MRMSAKTFPKTSSNATILRKSSFAPPVKSTSRSRPAFLTASLASSSTPTTRLVPRGAFSTHSCNRSGRAAQMAVKICTLYSLE